MIDETRTWSVGGIAGQEVRVVLGQIELEISQRKETHRWREKVGFVAFERPEDEIAILGHAGFLRYFEVMFSGAKREARFKRNASPLPDDAAA